MKRECNYHIPKGCICMGDGLYGMKCDADSHARVKTRYDKAFDEFSSLEAVDNDPFRIDGTIAHLVYIAQFEIDLVETGESDIDVRPHRRFVKKWSR